MRERDRSLASTVPYAGFWALLVVGGACASGTLGASGTGGQNTGGAAGTGAPGSGGAAGGPGAIGAGGAGGQNAGGAAGTGARGSGGAAGGHRGAISGAANCWSNASCSTGGGDSVCVTPDKQGGTHCGNCDPLFSPPGCQNDSDCASDAGPINVCDPTPCGCPFETCVLGCTSDAGCLEGLVCDPTHHCVAPACDASTGTGCPDDFGCQPSGQCARKTCTADSDCAVTCVLGACYSRAGYCSMEAI
jgi:hypothetical protein